MRTVENAEPIIEELHGRYSGVLYDKCLRMLGDKQEAEDAVQETFLSAFRTLENFHYGESHLPWLYRIATNACLKVLRTRYRKGTALLEKPDGLESQPDDALGQIHFRRLLERALNLLDERGQEIFVAYYLDGMDQSEIARSHLISRRAVVKRLAALRTQVGRLLAEDQANA